MVVQGDNVTSPEVQTAIHGLEQKALATGQIHQPFKVQVNARHDVAVVSMPLSGKGTDAASYRALDTLRGQVVPATIGSTAGVTARVTGMTAESKDFNDSMKSRSAGVWLRAGDGIHTAAGHVPLDRSPAHRNRAEPAIGGCGLRRPCTGLPAHLSPGPLGFKSTGAITSWLPLFLFVILFGLSMDYHVFIISRIRESYDRGMSTQDAIARGIKSTAGPVTSAAIVMVAVFGIFASLGALEFKQVRRGTGGGDPDRRDTDSRSPVASHHEAAGRCKLVSAQAARVVPASRTRARARLAQRGHAAGARRSDGRPLASVFRAS